MHSPGGQPQRVTLDDLAALNREISALVASGLPLEAGLKQVAADFGGGTGRLAARLAEETAAGKTLAEAVAAQGDALPPVYHAVVAAGMQSGRLAPALEGFADSAARMATLRRIAGQSIVYPILVVSVAWLMLLLIASTAGSGYEAFEIGDPLAINYFRWPPGVAWTLALGVPAVLVTAAIFWWRRSAAPPGANVASGWWRPAPGAGRATRLGGYASFADLLRLLLSCRVPLVEALPLAAEASGWPSLGPPARELAARLAEGAPLDAQRPALRELPPLVRAALVTPAGEPELLAALDRASQTYRERADAWIANVAVLLPVTITLALGLAVVGVYALVILHPYFTTLHRVSGWNWQ